MHSTMLDTPLTVAGVARHGATVHGRTGRVSTLTPDGVRHTSYAGIQQEAARLANALRALGVTGDERVATFMWNNQEHLAAYLAVPSMGAVLHPLNIRLPPDQLVYIANHAEDSIVLVDASLLPAFARLLPKLRTVRHVVVVGDADLGGGADQVALHSYKDILDGQSDSFDWPELDERSAAGMCYSSGTTGDPKGVVYSHRSVVLHSMALAMGDALALGPRDQVLPVVPMFHVLAWGIPYACFLVGAGLVMPDRFLQPEPLARAVADERVTVAAAVPSVWGAVLGYLDEHPDTDWSSLRDVLVGGSACSRALMEGFERHGVRILHAWGMTETSPVGTIAHPPVAAQGEDHWRYRLAQGRFVSLVEGRVRTPDGQIAPWDGTTVGELEVRGPWVSGRYFGEDGPDRFADGWLRTGDVGHIDADGYLTLTDRAKDVIKSGGEWISSVELENHLMAHPKVAEASVVGVPDDRWGERPLATMVVCAGETVTAAELRDFLVGKVARWQLPERWSFVAEVPKTSVGKYDKKVLRRWYAEGELAVETLAPPPREEPA
ncbi:long-chain fatty acid--CoA ligase [Actinopolymorpha alba]|uniref:long-chain fatty acid--CoA ligase n=1 Tax=Actinopolymorpha alba TaxID=533267 RepID=UPI00036AE21C|nr:long-chain fatty acid--CoA ligase [Actinopolymorpha alba]